MYYQTQKEPLKAHPHPLLLLLLLLLLPLPSAFAASNCREVLRHLLVWTTKVVGAMVEVVQVVQTTVVSVFPVSLER